MRNSSAETWSAARVWVWEPKSIQTHSKGAQEATATPAGVERIRTVSRSGLEIFITRKLGSPNTGFYSLSGAALDHSSTASPQREIMRKARGSAELDSFTCPGHSCQRWVRSSGLNAHGVQIREEEVFMFYHPNLKKYMPLTKTYCFWIGENI